MKILLTGATGFLGSHIAETLLEKGHELILTKRDSSNMWRCSTFYHQSDWINTDNENWIEEVCNYQPSVVINAAWEGVEADNREDWMLQLNNLCFQQKILEIAAKSKAKLVIGIGSQAEYGIFDGRVNELYATNPVSAYGTTKLCAQNIMKTFCEQNDIKWYWFRLFSCFGERESYNWLIPSTIKKIYFNEYFKLTLGEQEYEYIYVKDFTHAILQSIELNIPSNIYNISGRNIITIRHLIEIIKDYINPVFSLNFGSLHYRPNQSMQISGDTTRLNQYIQFNDTDFESNLYKTIDYYLNLLKQNESI